MGSHRVLCQIPVTKGHWCVGITLRLEMSRSCYTGSRCQPLPGAGIIIPGGPGCACSQPPPLGEALRAFNCSEQPHLRPPSTCLGPFKLSLGPPAPPCGHGPPRLSPWTCSIPMILGLSSSLCQEQGDPRGGPCHPHSGDRGSLSFSEAPQWLPEPGAHWGHPAPHPLGILQCLGLCSAWLFPCWELQGVPVQWEPRKSSRLFSRLGRGPRLGFGRNKGRYHPLPPTLPFVLETHLCLRLFCFLTSLLVSQKCLEELLDLPARGCDASQCSPIARLGLLGASPAPQGAFPITCLPFPVAGRRI